ncbi:hypothetical protein BTO06_05800 [Tenacibaculum sp. SZ-18]|uniref:hypothetical protein n=1 Tax=Tenacibaculum sp. SZ-18 TaxID=754423 RepID=UPI000C2D4432|nr:hypothetical protein [Tenacibaculum sp. SZ-18]AUC14683.1 hypothetical protein BTO06_05800 [Tenacibaculum sp. SZ-18]
MKKSILNVKGVEKIPAKDQKRINGGGGFGNPYNSTPINPGDPDGPVTPNWQFMCYSASTASYNHVQYFKSETDLSLTDRRYKCFRI